MVLAGGTSRRFGSDKLAHPLDNQTLLAVAVGGLPGGVRLLVVGPDPGFATDGPTGLSQARWVREDPAGGGPAAAIVAGLRAALAEPVDAIVVLPGDAPQAGAAATQLLARLFDDGVDAVMAVDLNGRGQPLQLALRPPAAHALIDLAGPTAGAGASARALVAGLNPPPRHHRLSADQAFDIDTQAQLLAWQLRDTSPVREVLAAVADLRARAVLPAERPIVVALAGPPGSGKSTLALALQLRTDAVVVGLDEAVGALGGQPLVILDGVDAQRLALADLVVHVGEGPVGGPPDGDHLVIAPRR